MHKVAQVNYYLITTMSTVHFLEPHLVSFALFSAIYNVTNALLNMSTFHRSFVRLIQACLSVSLVAVMFCQQLHAQGKYQVASQRELTAADLQGKSSAELKIMRNEIFARYGYVFKTKDMKEYFGSQPWYRPSVADVTSKLTALEKKNVELIKRFEGGATHTGNGILGQAVIPKELQGKTYILNESPFESVTMPKSNAPGNLTMEDIDAGGKRVKVPIQSVLALVCDTVKFFDGKANRQSLDPLSMLYRSLQGLWYLRWIGGNSGTSRTLIPDFLSGSNDDVSICPSMDGFFAVTKTAGTQSLTHWEIHYERGCKEASVDLSDVASVGSICSLSVTPLPMYLDEGEESWTDVRYALLVGEKCDKYRSEAVKFRSLIRTYRDDSPDDGTSAVVFELESLEPDDRLFVADDNEWLVQRKGHYYWLPRRLDSYTEHPPMIIPR